MLEFTISPPRPRQKQSPPQQRRPTVNYNVVCTWHAGLWIVAIRQTNNDSIQPDRDRPRYMNLLSPMKRALIPETMAKVWLTSIFRVSFSPSFIAFTPICLRKNAPKYLNVIRDFEKISNKIIQIILKSIKKEKKSSQLFR